MSRMLKYNLFLRRLTEGLPATSRWMYRETQQLQLLFTDKSSNNKTRHVDPASVIEVVCKAAPFGTQQ